MKAILTLLALLLSNFLLTSSVCAGEVEVVAAKASCRETRCSFRVTLRHDDADWNHYANKWEVLSEAGKILGERILLHPHIQEQPFTRSLSNVIIPPDVETVFIRGQDSVHGYGNKAFKINLGRER